VGVLLLLLLLQNLELQGAQAVNLQLIGRSFAQGHVYAGVVVNHVGVSERLMLGIRGPKGLWQRVVGRDLVAARQALQLGAQ
jgi:hypothetical protein